MSKFKHRLVVAVILLLLLAIIGLFIRRRAPVMPPAVATMTDTLWLTESTFSRIVHYRTDTAASKQLTKLRDELVGRANTIERLTRQIANLKLEKQCFADSLTRVTLDSLGIAVVTRQRGFVQTWRPPVWRERWIFLAGEESPTVKTSRLPVDCGLFVVGGGFDTRPDTWTPAPYVWAGLAITRQALTATAGPMFYDGQLKLRADVKMDWRF